MKQFDFDAARDAVFNTVTGLSNVTFDPENVVPHRGATEGQLKSVSDIIVELRNFLDEQGCDDPWAYIKQKVDELEEAQARCCETDWGQGATETITQRLNELEAQIEGCCTQDHGEQDIQQILDHIAGLEAQINDCCNRTCFGESTGTEETCDGATVDVSYSWNGYNPLTDGGQATATSSSGAPIVSFWFLSYDSNSGTYYKRSDAAAYGAWKWTIDFSGAMRASQYTAGTLLPIALAIVAVDANGCQGTVPIVLPGGTTS